MQNKLTDILKEASYKCDPALAFLVCESIDMRIRARTRFTIWAFSFLGILSLSLLVLAIRTLSSDLVQSGFYDYFSLIFSEGGSIVSYWKELGLSLLESLPTLSILLTLSLAFMCLLSLRHLVRNIGKQRTLSF